MRIRVYYGVLLAYIFAMGQGLTLFPNKLSYTQNIQHLKGNWYHDRLYWKKDVRNLLKKANLNLLDIWHRALLPKRSFVPPFFNTVERIDNWLCNNSLLKYFATNIEFVASKK